MSVEYEICPSCGQSNWTTDVACSGCGQPLQHQVSPLLQSRAKAKKRKAQAARHLEKAKYQLTGYLSAFVVAVVSSIWIFGGHASGPILQKAYDETAVDFAQRYEIAKRNGSAIDAYVAAQLAVAGYLQAKDEKNYRKWKQIERAEAIRAGMSPD